MPEQSLAEAVERLSAGGYEADFRVEGEQLCEPRSGRCLAPEAFVVDEIVRIEGDSDPDDEAIVFALHSRDGSLRGTWAVAYGPGMDPREAEVARRLHDGRRRGAQGE